MNPSIALVFLACLSTVLSFPWGPFVLPRRSVRQCCPLGLRSEEIWGAGERPYQHDYCPATTPCCFGLVETARVNPGGLIDVACEPDQVEESNGGYGRLDDLARLLGGYDPDRDR